MVNLINRQITGRGFESCFRGSPDGSASWSKRWTRLSGCSCSGWPCGGRKFVCNMINRDPGFESRLHLVQFLSHLMEDLILNLRGCVAQHPRFESGSNFISLLLSSWTVLKLNPSCAKQWNSQMQLVVKSRAKYYKNTLITRFEALLWFRQR